MQQFWATPSQARVCCLTLALALALALSLHFPANNLGFRFAVQHQLQLQQLLQQQQWQQQLKSYAIIGQLFARFLNNSRVLVKLPQFQLKAPTVPHPSRQDDHVAEWRHGRPWLPEQSVDEADGHRAQGATSHGQCAEPERFQRAQLKSVSNETFNRKPYIKTIFAKLLYSYMLYIWFRKYFSCWDTCAIMKGLKCRKTKLLRI